MTSVTNRCLPRASRATIIQVRVKYATVMVLSLLAHAALAQQPPATAAPSRDDLDVTMQIIVDPDAKLPDEIVRRIPLPERKSTPPAATQTQSKGARQPDKPDRQDKSNASEAKELAREAGQSARDSAKEAREQSEQARRAAAEERRRRNEDNPNRPPTPPGRPPRD
jgi:hypothetical protein